MKFTFFLFLWENRGTKNMYMLSFSLELAKVGGYTTPPPSAHVMVTKQSPLFKRPVVDIKSDTLRVQK
jgi:hypothetical protein